MQVAQVDVPVSVLGHCFLLKNQCSSHKKGNDTKPTHLNFEVDEEELESEAKEHENELEEECEYKKKPKVEPALREWIETKGCRRDVADKYFNNPPNRHRKSCLFHFVSFPYLTHHG